MENAIVIALYLNVIVTTADLIYHIMRLFYERKKVRLMENALREEGREEILKRLAPRLGQ